MLVIEMARRAMRRSSLIGFAVLAILILASCADTRTYDRPTSDAAAPGLLPGHVVTEQGRAAADLYLPIFIIAVGVFVLVEGLLLIITLRFRRKPDDDTLPPQTHGNHRLELIWTAIPALIVTGLFIASTMVLMDVEATSEEPGVTVDVTAFQWQWTFDYQAQALSFTGSGDQGPEMVVPVDEPVLFRLHAQDVIHSFYVPQFFRKLDVVPGRVNQFEVTITEQEINERVNARGNLGPIDDLQVHITPEGLLVDLSAYGFDGTYRAAIVERDGSVALDGGSLDGPLAYAVSDGDLEQAINRELAVALSAAGYRVAGVTLGDGALTLALTAGS